MTYTETLAAAAVKVAASLGVHATDPVILANGANVIVHLSPAPVVAKVAASTPAVRPDSAAWLQRELDVARFLAGRACSTASPRLDGPRILAAYGEVPVQLEVCQQLRKLHLTVWYNLYAERLPDLAPRAAELLTLWPVP